MQLTLAQLTAGLTWFLTQAQAVLTALGESSLASKLQDAAATLAAGGAAVTAILDVILFLVNDFLSYGFSMLTSQLPSLLAILSPALKAA